MSTTADMPGGEALADVAAAADLLEAAELQLNRSIQRARQAGWSWADIAEAMDLHAHRARELNRCLMQRIRRSRERAAS